MADALASGASVRKDVGVQVPPRPLFVMSQVILDTVNPQAFRFFLCRGLIIFCGIDSQMRACLGSRRSGIAGRRVGIRH